MAKKNLIKLIGSEEIFDEKEKFEKMDNKKKNQNKINNEDDFINIDGSVSKILEVDSVLESFKNALIEETQFNNGNKVIATLSSDFFQKLKNNL